ASSLLIHLAIEPEVDLFLDHRIIGDVRRLGASNPQLLGWTNHAGLAHHFHSIAVMAVSFASRSLLSDAERSGLRGSVATNFASSQKRSEVARISGLARCLYLNTC